LHGLHPRDYEHPFDKQALDILEGTPGFEYVSKKMFEYGFEQLYKVEFTGSSIRVNERNFPELYKTYQEVAEILYMDQQPELYITFSENINAFAAGVQKPIIVVTSACIDNLTTDELMHIMGHEMGHVKSNHVLYHTMGRVLNTVGGIVGQMTLGLGKVVFTGLQLAIYNWQRMSEFTADRAGLLTCQDPNIACSTMIKLAGLPKKYYHKNIVEDFIQQAKDFEDLDYENISKIAKLLASRNRSHPWTVVRCAEFFKWVDSGEFDDIINFHENRQMEMKVNDNDEACPNCNYMIVKGNGFCGNCGKKMVWG